MRFAVTPYAGVWIEIIKAVTGATTRGSLPTRPNYIAECLHTSPHHSHTYHIPYMRFSSCGGGELCSGSFLLHTRMSSAEILHAIYSSDSIRYPFPDHIWSRRGCEFPEGLLYAGIVFYRNHQ